MAGLDRREFISGARGSRAGADAARPGGRPGIQAESSALSAAGRARAALRGPRQGAAPAHARATTRPGSSTTCATTASAREAVVQPVSTQDVAAVVRWANRFDVNVVARSGGHSYAGYSTTGSGVVVDLSAHERRAGVRTGARRSAPGAQLIDMYSVARAPRPDRAGRLLPLGRRGRPRARRRPRAGGPPLGADDRQPPRAHDRHGRRPHPPGHAGQRTRTCSGRARAAAAATSGSSRA